MLFPESVACPFFMLLTSICTSMHWLMEIRASPSLRQL